MHPYVGLRGPTYRENSHAKHTWHQHSHETACFVVPETPFPVGSIPIARSTSRLASAAELYYGVVSAGAAPVNCGRNQIRSESDRRWLGSDP